VSTVRRKAGYLGRSVARGLRRSTKDCPSCGTGQSDVVSRKYLVTALRRCHACQLLFRAPIDNPVEVRKFYEDRYESGLTTDTPDPCELEELKRNGFAETSKNFARYVNLLRAFGCGSGSRLLDLGCSWGYGAWQMRQAGFRVVGHEVSKRRCDYAREHMGIEAVPELEHISGCFDVIFSAHVLEHVAALEDVLSWSECHLERTGLFVAVTPNGSNEYRQRFPRRWNRHWGDVHPLYLDETYWRNRLHDRPYFVTSRIDDYQAMRDWSRAGEESLQQTGRLDGWELLVAWRHPRQRAGWEASR